MKYFALVLIVFALILLMYRRAYYVRQKKFYNLLTEYNQMYRLCHNVIEKDIQITGMLKKQLKKYGHNFKTSTEIREYMVCVGYAIQEEEIVNDINIEDFYFVKKEYQIFVESFTAVKRIALSKNENILH